MSRESNATLTMETDVEKTHTHTHTKDEKFTGVGLHPESVLKMEVFCE